jgi:hypothetical protein
MNDGGLPIIGLRLPEGRTGSTLVMALLGTAPEIAFDRRYPAEYRWASYFARMAAQMTEPYDAARDRGVTDFFFGPQPAWGPVPFETDLADVAELSAPLLRGLWTAWSATVVERDPAVRWYAEKLAVPIDPLLASGLELRVVDLLRDPRDVLASIRAFRRRGYGPEEDGFVERFAAQLAAMAATPPDVDRVVLRYEDLVADLDGCADRLGSWLGVRLDADAVRDGLHDHRTSPSPEASVGRWRHELDPGEADDLVAALGPAMSELGVDL